MAVLAAVIVLLDQLTKALVLNTMVFGRDERVIVDGFFKFVHWGNTGAAWSMFHGNNEFLAIVSLIALLVLFLYRRHFDIRTTLGQISLGLIFGGIVGNLIDFNYFYLQQRGGREVGFPAFNIADMAICSGVGLLFILSWRQEGQSAPSLAKEGT